MENILNLRLLQEADLKGKIVLVRVDHNVVKKGEINDAFRIDSTLGTLFHIVAKGGKFILMTHVGRPKDKKTGGIKTDSESSVQPVVDYLQSKLHITLGVPVFESKDNKGYPGIGDKLKSMITDLKENKIDGIYLPNTRWFAGEEAKGEEADAFSKELAGLADVYVNDAFGSWQPHASTTGVTRYLPSYAGFLMQKELSNLDRIYKPQAPFIAVVAGLKFDTKIDSLNSLINIADHLILGGVIYKSYLCAKYNIQIKDVEQEDIELAGKFVDYASKFPGKLVELPFLIETETMEGIFEGKHRIIDTRKFKAGDKFTDVLDASKESFNDNRIREIFLSAETVFVNAVMGYTPYFNEGTIALNNLIDENKKAMKLYGGGDTLLELKRLCPGIYIKALDSPKYYIFTGGGTVLKAIEEGTYMGLQPVKALSK